MLEASDLRIKKRKRMSVWREILSGCCSAFRMILLQDIFASFGLKRANGAAATDPPAPYCPLAATKGRITGSCQKRKEKM